MAEHTHLVSLPRPPGGAELVRALEGLLAEAREGRLVGLAFVATYAGGGGFEVDALGAALVDPATTLGLLRVLEQKLVDAIVR